MKKEYFYVPFTKEELKATVPDWNGELGQGMRDEPDLLEQIKDYRDTYDDREVEIVLAGDAGDKLRNLGSDDSLYVMGHGGPNSNELWSEDDAEKHPELKKVTADVVAGRLQEDGVSPTVGKVKLMCCHSNEGGAESFSEHFRQAQARKGLFPNAEVSSYRGALGLVDKPEGSNEIHKTSNTREGTVRASMRAYIRTADRDVPREEHRAGKRSGMNH